MAYGDKRGAQYDVSLLSSAGYPAETWTVETTGGTPVDLTGSTITVVVRDDREHASDYGGTNDFDQSITLTITDAAAGQFQFRLPETLFTNTEGGRLTYELYRTPPSGGRIAMAWGFIDVQERG